MTEKRGVRIAQVDDTRSCPVVSYCSSREGCLLGNGDLVPRVEMVFRDRTGVGPEIVCVDFRPIIDVARCPLR